MAPDAHTPVSSSLHNPARDSCPALHTCSHPSCPSFPDVLHNPHPLLECSLSRPRQDGESGLALEYPPRVALRTPFVAWVPQLLGLKGAPQYNPVKELQTVLHSQRSSRRPWGSYVTRFNLGRLLLLITFVLLPSKIWFERRL